MKRIYHHHDKWEDAKAGMWRRLAAHEEQEFLQVAVGFTGNTELYSEWMQRVVLDWPFACEHNLSATNMNRQAWIGHAACCYATGCPEYVTRRAWWLLTQAQRDAANQRADVAIALWKSRCQRSA